MNILRDNIQYLTRCIMPSRFMYITTDTRYVVFNCGNSSSTALAVQYGVVYVMGSPHNKHAWGADI